MSSEQMPEVTMTRVTGIFWVVFTGVSIALQNTPATIACGVMAVLAMLFDISHYLEKILDELQAARKTKETEE